jgi:hypothetical protein
MKIKAKLLKKFNVIEFEILLEKEIFYFLKIQNEIKTVFQKELKLLNLNFIQKIIF